MANDLTNPDTTLRVSPEALEVATTYLECCDIKQTADILGIDSEKVSYYLNKKEVKRFIDTVFLDQGYLNRHKLQVAMTDLIEKKMLEMEEAEIGSSKDIADLLMMAHKMRMEELKLIQAGEKEAGPKVVVNTGAGQFGQNYDSLLGKLMGGTK